MANFHLEIKHHGKKTKSIEALIAYRSRGKLGKYDYSKKSDLIENYDLFPEEFRDSDIVKKMSSNEGFCEAINEIEKRRDSQICDEIIISLQHELTLEENKKLLNKLLNEFCISNEKRFAKVFIHNPSGSNLHAHVILTQRPLENAENGEIRLGKKFRQEFARGKPKNAENVVLMRSRWSALCNNEFYKKNLNVEINHESLRKQKEKALKAKNYELASKFDRPSSYVPLNVLSSGFVVHEHHTLSFDFKANSRLQDLFRNRRNVEKCDVNKVFEEKQLREELELKNLFRKGNLKTIKRYKNVSCKLLKKESEIKITHYSFGVSKEREQRSCLSLTSIERKQRYELKRNFERKRKRTYSF